MLLVSGVVLSALREKIVKELTTLINNCEYCIDDGQVSNCPKCMLRYQIADRILALLPKVPELRWDGAQLFLGSLRVGFVTEDRNGQMLLHAGEKMIGGAMPMDVARAAVEAAVRKALGRKA